jgi:putative DNA primase/helicase
MTGRTLPRRRSLLRPPAIRPGAPLHRRTIYMTTTQEAPQILAENIPAEMTTYHSWVCWRYEQHNGEEKPTKVPYDPLSGLRASSTDSRTWRSFEEACVALGNSGYDGIGFVFSSGDPYTGIDLDRCRDPETGNIKPWAQEVIDTFDSYTEVSPSGTGVHIITAAALPAACRKKQGSVETYSMRRFFTVTGQVVS